MIRLIPLLAVIAVLLWHPTEGRTAPSSAHFGSYHALVIGNDEYEHLPKLNNAVQDAKDVSFVLKRMYGFKVQTLLNASRADIFDALTNLRSELNWDSNLVVYYAGHGVLDDITEKGYWLPVDAAENNPANWVANSTITNMLKAIRAKHVMVIADSCYSGTLIRSASAKLLTAKERDIWWERMSQKKSRTAMVSGGLEPVLDGGGGKNSVFATALMSVLKDNRHIMDGNAVYQALKRSVALGSPQTPQYSDIRQAGHGGGDFLFVRRGGIKAETKTSETPKEVTTTSTQPSEKADMLFWQSIKGSTDKDDYDAYLEQFPGGIFARLARKKVENLGKPKQVAKLTPDNGLKSGGQDHPTSNSSKSLKLHVQISDMYLSNYQPVTLIIPIEHDGEFSQKAQTETAYFSISGKVRHSKIKANGLLYNRTWTSKATFDFILDLSDGPKRMTVIALSSQWTNSKIELIIDGKFVDTPSTGTTAASK